jgi:hypothetical protein
MVDSMVECSVVEMVDSMAVCSVVEMVDSMAEMSVVEMVDSMVELKVVEMADSMAVLGCCDGSYREISVNKKNCEFKIRHCISQLATAIRTPTIHRSS